MKSYEGLSDKRARWLLTNNNNKKKHKKIIIKYCFVKPKTPCHMLISTSRHNLFSSTVCFALLKVKATAALVKLAKNITDLYIKLKYKAEVLPMWHI